MQPAKLNQRQQNPRDLLKQPDGLKQLAAILRQRAGYVPQEVPLRALGNALRRNSNLLIEGLRGAGKTAFPEALAAAFNLPLFYLQCMPGLTRAEILYQWDQTAQSQFVQQQVAAGVQLSTAQAQQWTLPFLVLGEVLEAFVYSATAMYPPVLVIDEADKLEEVAQDMFLQVLGRGYAAVPRLKPDNRVGIIPELAEAQKKSTWPIVIITGNNLRNELSSPFRSRCRYGYFELPTPAEEVKILHARVPAAAAFLLYQTVQLINGIRRMGGITEKPGLRESIELLDTLVEKRTTRIDESVILENLDALAKTETDYKNLRAGATRLAQLVSVTDPEISGLVRDALASNPPDKLVNHAGGRGASAGGFLQ